MSESAPSEISLRIDGNSVTRSAIRNPESTRYVQADHYDALINWLSGQYVCEWKADEDGIQQTQCGNAFEFCADSAMENGFKFCPYCGNRITGISYE